MDNINSILHKYFKNLLFFYRHLQYRIFIIIVLSITVGILDGFGLAMFIPLLEHISIDGGNISSERMGNLAFLIQGFSLLGINMTLTNVLLVMLVFFILKGLIVFLEKYKRTIYEQYFVRNLREKNIIALADYKYYDFVNADVGRIQNTMTGEVGRVMNGLVQYMSLIQNSMLLLVYTSLAFLANPQFALLIVVGGLLTNTIFNKLYDKTKKLSRKLTTHNHGFQGLIIQQVSQFKYLKATGVIREYANKLIEKVYKIEETQKKIGIISALMNGIREPMMMTVVVVVILLQVNVFGGKLSLIILSILFFYRALGSVMALQTTWNHYLSVTGSLENIESFNEELNSGKEKVGKEIMNRFSDCIQLNNVSFNYGNTQIIKNISLRINKNETIAFVGESGSGKTTLMNILSGLLVPNQGKIMIDGIPYSDLNIISLQRRIGYITQEPVIFNDTVFNNVTFWNNKSNASFKKFRDVLHKSNIDDFIFNLAQKEETILGNNGINLSGGQKQRISIARELYKDVDFLFMDEATSALDSETEKQIQTNIESLHGNYTMIIIAHRLSTIKTADRVIVMDKGQIQSIGTFDELIHQSTSFKKMVETQEV